MKTSKKAAEFRNDSIKVYIEWFDYMKPICLKIRSNFKDTQREKAPSNKTPALTRSLDLDIWKDGTSIRGS